MAYPTFNMNIFTLGLDLYHEFLCVKVNIELNWIILLNDPLVLVIFIISLFIARYQYLFYILVTEFDMMTQSHI